MICNRGDSPILEYILNKLIFLCLRVVLIIVIVLVVPAYGYLRLRPLHDLVRQLLEPCVVVLLSRHDANSRCLMRDALELVDMPQLLQILSLDRRGRINRLRVASRSASVLRASLVVLGRNRVLSVIVTDRGSLVLLSRVVSEVLGLLGEQSNYALFELFIHLNYKYQLLTNF